MPTLPPPHNKLVTPLLTDLYQLTMTYAYWKNSRHDDDSIFELFFRKNPFKGEYTIFCGLDEVLKFVDNFSFSKEDISYLRTVPALQNCEPAFWDYLYNLDCSGVTLHAMREGTLAFPRIPLIVVQGPLGIAQLLETTLLTLVNYPSLVATNAARMVVAAQANMYPESLTFHKRVPKCVEFGLRRAQGPDGGFSASKYSAIAGFVGTSNVQAGKFVGLSLAGTHAHAFVQAYSALSEVETLSVVDKTKGEGAERVLLLAAVLKRREELGPKYLRTNNGELAAFIAYAAAFPESFLCLIDTYDTLRSGILNFSCVGMVLVDLGYTPRGIRLDSGDLAYLSLQCAKHFSSIPSTQDGSDKYQCFANLDIVASNDINEEVLHALNKQGHAITVFGIGTNLVTCQAQPALGCVYKLVEIEGTPRMKLSQDIEKVLIPGKKKPYRLYGVDGWPLLDLLVGDKEDMPAVGVRVLCRHPFIERKRAAVRATRILPLHHVVFDKGRVTAPLPTLQETKDYVKEQLALVRPDLLRPLNPSPYKVSVSQDLFAFLHDLWQAETPVMEIE
jgi:nicotinate phosphoribosyltransferase